MYECEVKTRQSEKERQDLKQQIQWERQRQMNGKTSDRCAKDQIKERSLRQGLLWHIAARLNASPCQHIGCLSKNRKRERQRDRVRETNQERGIYICTETERREGRGWQSCSPGEVDGASVHPCATSLTEDGDTGEWHLTCLAESISRHLI